LLNNTIQELEDKNEMLRQDAHEQRDRLEKKISVIEDEKSMIIDSYED